MINDDIYFYDFDFNLIHELPNNGGDVGYSSINAKIELNNSGSLEIVFYDNELKKKIEDSPDNIIVVWRDFQGFLTSYKFTQKESRLFGMHLNGLLHRTVVAPLTNTTNKAENIAKNAVDTIAWLTFAELKGLGTSIEYETSKYQLADEYLQNLFKIENIGYKIKADIINKKFIFEVIHQNENRLVISENNLNAYDFEVNYNNKELSFGGWYSEKQPDDANGNKVDNVWKYITLDNSKAGIYKIDAVLSSETATEAQNELKALKAKMEITTKTRNIEHNIDYCLGDTIRVQKGNATSRKLITGISMWKEISYGEEPIMEAI